MNMAHASGVMELCTKATGKAVLNKVRVFCNTQMEVFIREILFEIIPKATVKNHFLMGQYTSVLSSKECFMVRASTNNPSQGRSMKASGTKTP